MLLMLLGVVGVWLEGGRKVVGCGRSVVGVWLEGGWRVVGGWLEGGWRVVGEWLEARRNIILVSPGWV